MPCQPGLGTIETTRCSARDENAEPAPTKGDEVILPIGHEHTTVRRLPWVSFGAMALCLLVHIAVGTGGVNEDQINERFQSAIDYYFEHPYLNLDPRMEDILVQEVGQRDAEAFREALRDFAPPEPEDAGVRAVQQEELNRRVDLAFEALEAIPFFRYGLVPADYSIADAVSSMFLHGGWMHLIGNLFFLYLTGPFLEDVWGRWLYSGFYLLAGVLAATGFALHYPTSEVPLIGASGAVAGLMGAFLIRYWTTKIRFVYFFFFIGVGRFDAPAWLMLPLWLLREFLFASASPASVGGGAGGVAHWAHVYGFVFGVVVAVVIRQTRLEERVLSPAIEASISMVDTSFEEALEARGAGRLDEAFDRLQSMVREDPDNVPVCLALWGVAVDLGRQHEVVGVLARVVRVELQNGDLQEAQDHWRELTENRGTERLSLAVEARLAEQLREHGDRQGAAEVATSVAGRLSLASPVGVVMRLCRLAAEVAPSVAPTVMAVASQHPDLPDSARAELEQMVPAGAPAAVPPVPEAPGPVEEPVAEAVVTGPLPVAAAGRKLRLVEVVPNALKDTGLIVQRERGASSRLALETVQAVAVVGIQPPDQPASLLVDLLLDLPEGVSETLRVVRIRSNRFDPRKVLADAAGMAPLEAIRMLVEELLGRSGGAPLPSREAALGRPYAVFPSEAAYESEVLGVATADPL